MDLDRKESPTRSGRVKSACVECRKNKRKCDGETPACGLCVKAGKECCYASRNMPRKRKYWDEEYVHNLEYQVEALQALLKNCTEQNASHVIQHDLTPDSEPIVVEQAKNLNSQVAIAKSGNQRSRLAVDDLSSLMLTMDIRDSGEPSFTLPSNAFQLLRVSTQSAVLPPILPNTSTKAALNSGKTKSWTGFELRDDLVDAFLIHFNPFHQFLSSDELKSTDWKTYHNGPQSSNTDVHFLWYLVCAVGAHFLLPSSDKAAIDLYTTEAERLAILCCRKYPGANTIKALSLLGWIEMVAGNEIQSYIYNAMATGMILSLGYHTSAIVKVVTEPAELSTVECEVRTFWAYFSVDRVATAIVGTNCTIPWQRVRVLPSMNFASEHPSLFEIAFDHECQLWHLWDSVLDQIAAFSWTQTTRQDRNEIIFKAHQALTTFHKNINPVLTIAKHDIHPSVAFYHIAYHTAIILTQRPILDEPTDSAPFRLALHSMTYAAGSISRILRILRNAFDVGNAPPQLINHTLVATIAHLLNATSGSEGTLGRQSAVRLRICVEVLESMKERWEFRVEKSLKLIVNLAWRWEVVWALPVRMCNYGAFSTGPSLPGHVSNTSNGDSELVGEAHDSVSSYTTAGTESWDLGNWETIEENDVLGQADFSCLDSSALNWLYGNPENWGTFGQ